MKAVEFCYWLQGLFELADPMIITSKQEACVRAHLDLVKRVEPDHDNLFVAWLDGVVDTKIDGHMLTERDTAKIKRHLAQQFQHAIDPSYQGDKADLQSTHDGAYAHSTLSARPQGPLMRC